MNPIVPLKVEHGLIDQMVGAIRDRSIKLTLEAGFDLAFIETAVDFLRTYADRTHHGKEEDILFRELKEKDLSPEDQETMEELVEEHVYARETVGQLVEAKEAYLEGDEDALDTVLLKIGALLELYPKHIKKEDDGFFPAAVRYFDADEQEAMLEEMHAFDREMIHEKYRSVVEGMSE